MADNYLEKRYEEVFGKGAGKAAGFHHKSLDTLLEAALESHPLKEDYPVAPRQIELIMAAGRKVAQSESMLDIRPGAAQVAVFAKVEATPLLYTVLGMALQNMLLKASDLGLAASKTLAEGKDISDAPLAVIKIGSK